MVSLTIFTPAFNRADLLPRAFEALLKQKNKDFIWLIVDDGSTDATESVVKSFQQQPSGFLIKYIYKENGGLHTAYNTAIANIDTELSMCIDSDDWIAEDAVEKILKCWKKIKRPDCAGIVGLDSRPDGSLICRMKAKGYINLIEYDLHHRWGGDRKLVIRTDLYRSVAPMPVFPGEKNFNPQYMHIRIAEKYSFFVLNVPLCVVDYQETGMSAGMFKQYLNSPNSFAEYRRLKMTVHPNSFLQVARNAIHYDSSCILAGKPWEILTKSPKRIMTTAVSPAGLLLSIYIKMKTRNRLVKKQI